MSEEGGFLSRWSRRKRAALVSPLAAAPAEVPPEALAEALAEPAPEPEFDPATLPPLDSLAAGSDLAAFLRPGVPQALRQAALRRVWSLDPAIRDYVGPADYAWDFNAPDGVPGFALELGGDVARLLAQAIGLSEATVTGEAAPAAHRAEPEHAPPEAAPAPAPEAALLPAARPAWPSPALAEATPPPARRRHGGARPA